MDKDGKHYLFVKNESVPKFLQSFDGRLLRLYEKLALIISVYETTQKMGEVNAYYIIIHTGTNQIQSIKVHPLIQYCSKLYLFLILSNLLTDKLFLLLKNFRLFIKENRLHLLVLIDDDDAILSN